MDDETLPHLMVSLSLVFPNMDRAALAAHLAPVMEAAIAAGGRRTSVYISPYDDEKDPE